MDIYEVVMPVTLRDGKVAFDPKQSEKAKSIAVRNAQSLKQIKDEPIIYQIVGELRLKVGTVFAYDGNVKRMLGSQLRKLNLDPGANEIHGTGSAAGNESGEGAAGENGQGADSQVDQIPPNPDDSQSISSNKVTDDQAEAEPGNKGASQTAKKSGKAAGQTAKKGS